ncbi:MAG: hypothetical protein L0G70_04540, partial [Rubrobacter sp.]|nr:hypothetical protein [Rubrobacter sp.]
MVLTGEERAQILPYERRQQARPEQASDYPQPPSAAFAADEDDRVWISVTAFVEPTTLLLGDLAEVPPGGAPGELETIKRAPARFDAEGMDGTQHFTTSEDGTRVPYFEISPRGA